MLRFCHLFAMVEYVLQLHKLFGFILFSFELAAFYSTRCLEGKKGIVKWLITVFFMY